LRFVPFVGRFFPQSLSSRVPCRLNHRESGLLPFSFGSMRRFFFLLFLSAEHLFPRYKPPTLTGRCVSLAPVTYFFFFGRYFASCFSGEPLSRHTFSLFFSFFLLLLVLPIFFFFVLKRNQFSRRRPGGPHFLSLCPLCFGLISFLVRAPIPFRLLLEGWGSVEFSAGTRQMYARFSAFFFLHPSAPSFFLILFPNLFSPCQVNVSPLMFRSVSTGNVLWVIGFLL